MLFTPSGIVRLLRLVQPQKALWGISVIPAGSVTLTREDISAKPPLGNSVNPAGSVSVVTFFIPLTSNLVHEFGIVNSVIPVQPNAYSPISSKPSGNVICVSAGQ